MVESGLLNRYQTCALTSNNPSSITRATLSWRGSRDTSQFPRAGEQQGQTETEPIGAEEAAKSLPALNQAARGKRRRRTHAEGTLLQQRIVAIYDSPLIVGRVGDLLEGRTIEVPVKDASV